MGGLFELLTHPRTPWGHYRKEIIFAVIIFLVSSISFALGYLANREFNHAPIVIEACPMGQ